MPPAWLRLGESFTKSSYTHSLTSFARFWLGLTVGSMVLGFVTPRIGENFAICLYLALAAALQILFWLVPSFVASSVAIAFVGFLLGPLFPAVVVAITKLLPPHLHVPTIGFTAAVGACGACILPFTVGAIASATSLYALQPIILAMLIIAATLWAFGMPRITQKENKHGVRRKMDEARKVVKQFLYNYFATRL